MKSVVLDNILHPYNETKNISYENGWLMIQINRDLCWCDYHKIEKYEKNKKKSVYENMKIKHYIKIGDICPICMDEIWTIRDAFLTECGHGFHVSCMNNYCDKEKPENLSCPMCRCDIEFPDSLLINKYYTTNFIDKLDDLWMNIHLIVPVKCFDTPNHYRGMNRYCKGCKKYREEGDENKIDIYKYMKTMKI